MIQIDQKNIRAWIEKADIWNCPRYMMSDTGSGFLFADWAKDMARYCYSHKKWYVYDGVKWTPDEGGEVIALCKQLAIGVWASAAGKSDAVTRFATKWQQQRQLETILRSAASVYPVSERDFDKDPMLLNCLNCTLDLRTMQSHNHRPEDVLTQVAGVKYDPTAECSRWTQFIQEVTEGDKRKAEYLQRLCGYGLTGLTKEEKFCILYGPTTRNGKGTFTETIMALMGSYAASVRPETIARSKRSSAAPSEDLARLKGVRAAWISELPKNMQMDAATIKKLTGGGSLRVRYLYGSEFEFTPIAKLFIDTNYLPQTSDMTIFDSDRATVIPFNRHFSEEERDTELKWKLRKPEALSGILNWCIRGLRAYKINKLREPPSIKEATAAYRRECDKIMRFIEDELEAGSGYEVRTQEVFDRFTLWCNRNGYERGGQAAFNRDLEKHVQIVRRHPKAGGEKTTLITGRRLRPLGMNPVA